MDKPEKLAQEYIDRETDRTLKRVDREITATKDTLNRLRREFVDRLKVAIETMGDIPDAVTLIQDPDIIFRAARIPHYIQDHRHEDDTMGIDLRLDQFTVDMNVGPDEINCHRYSGGTVYVILVPRKEEEDDGEE